MKPPHKRTAFERKLLRRSSKKWSAWVSRPEWATHPDALKGCVKCWPNDRYGVQLIVSNGLHVLMVRRHDEGDDFPWRDLQRIKDELVGEDREAVQVFPKKSEIVDEADMAHIWLVPEDEGLPLYIRELRMGAPLC